MDSANEEFTYAWIVNWSIHVKLNPKPKQEKHEYSHSFDHYSPYFKTNVGKTPIGFFRNWL